MHDDYRAQHILRGKVSNFTAVFWQKNAVFHGIFWLLFFEAPTPLTSTKAYLRYLMSLAVILPLIQLLLC